MKNETINEIIEQVTSQAIKAIAIKVLKDLKTEMPTSNTWQYDYAFENVCYKYGIEMKEICDD